MISRNPHHLKIGGSWCYKRTTALSHCYTIIIKMGLLSKVLLGISIVLLSHSGFSSHEFRQLLKNTSEEIPSSMLRHIPIDIRLEAIIGLVLFVMSVFLSFNKITYYPLQGERKLLEFNQYLQDIDMSKANNVNNLIGRDPYGVITYTPNFVDIRQKRKQMLESHSNIEKLN